MAKMRSREVVLDAPPESESEALSLSPSPAPRIGGNLSSMVVKPSVSSGGGSDLDIGYASDERPRDTLPPHRRRDSAQDSHRHNSPASGRRLGGSSPPHRRGSPDGFRRRVFQSGLQRRGSPLCLHRRGSPPAFHPRSQRFQNDTGYMQRSGSISPLHRQRVNDGYYEPDFGHPRGPRSGRGMRGRGGGRFRDVLPPAFGRGGRSYTRGFNSSAHAISPFEGEFIHRNDPNLSPREGDWICRNPLCGNLNFARRTYCNNCHKYRYDEPDRSSHSPRRAYVSSPLRSLSPKLPASPIDRGPRRDFNGYRSPRRDLGSDDLREFKTSLIPPRRGGKFLNHVIRDRMDFREDNFREKGRSDWPVGDWERRGRDTVVFDSRVKRRPLSPQDRWIRDTRDRSRSPIGGRLPRGSFAGRGRGGRHYNGPYVGNGRADDLDRSRSPIGGRLPRGSFVGRGRGRGDRHCNGLYVGNGRADDLDGAHDRGYRHGVARGRSPDIS